jgi:alpha-D-ribose 1-methylphosphonate 5-triphosphate synthase subunit PhnH
MADTAARRDDGLKPGFADPVHDAQTAFRALLQALARPGRVQHCGARLDPPALLGSAMTATALTLVDADTPLWLAPAVAAPAVADYLRFHCSVPIVADPGEAAFALAPAHDLPALERFPGGSDRAPERSATVVIEVPALVPGAADGWTLSGPGIRETERLRVHGLPADFLQQWQANHEAFPPGVDLLFTCGDRLCGLPRTTALREG